MVKKTQTKSTMIAHHLPHRTRVKLPRSHRDPATLKKVTDSISKVSTVKDVQFNDRTGSMVVYHEEDTKILEHINGALGEVAGEVFEAILAAEEVEFPGLSLIGTFISSLMGKADDEVSSATNNVVDLKIMVPLAFLGAGFYQASRNAAWLTQVPAWVLFYFAYDSYTRFHGPGNQPNSERAIPASAIVQPNGAADVEVEQTTKKITRVTQTSAKHPPNSGATT